MFLGHPGGPFYARRDDGCWTIPKGEIGEDEAPLAAARREFAEETGFAPEGDVVPLGTVRLRSGKVIEAWAVRGDGPEGRPIRSNVFTLEWPPRSGRVHAFPELDRAQFFPLPVARRKIQPGQLPFLERLLDHAAGAGNGAARAATT